MKQAKQLVRVDDRWSGEHGIGRFATEVVRRLRVSWTPLGGGSSPTSPVDVFNPRRWALKPTDVVYSPGFNAGLTRARQLLNIHDLIHLQIKTERSVLKTLYYNVVVRWAVRRAGVVMTDSLASSQAIRTWIRKPDVDIVVVGCGRSEAFVPDGDRVSFERPTFVYVGNMKPHKNFPVLLEALALRPEYDLVVVSQDSSTASAHIEAYGLSDRATIQSGVSDADLAKIYRGASGVLQPSLLEGFGLPALEGMSCGTRVAHWVGCESVAEICAGQGIGVTSATGATEWADALDALVAGAGEGQLQMDAAWQELYTWDRVAENVDRVIRDYLERLTLADNRT